MQTTAQLLTGLSLTPGTEPTPTTTKVGIALAIAALVIVGILLLKKKP